MGNHSEPLTYVDNMSCEGSEIHGTRGRGSHEVGSERRLVGASMKDSNILPKQKRPLSISTLLGRT